MLASLLIANRGEIVARVARTARRLGVATTAIASEADRGAPYLAACDRVVAIGGERAADSYLRIDAVVAAAIASGSQAVHPGYGFLSENADFAEAVEAAGKVWVGPPPAAMRALADKSSARQRMRAAGVPVLPGYDGLAQDAATLRREALRLGFPLMVKAVAGGGGRGMRLVESEVDLDAAIASAAGEAGAAFGDARLLLERAVMRARHVEIQVFADSSGHVIHLGERDCSLQRRHQKLVEEAPSPAVSPTLRRHMGEVAVAVAREVGYRGAGTVEFLLDRDGAFWFIEMNTRLQVEHAVTEALVGVDLVEWQLRVAAGELLPMGQDEALARFEAGGHAIEVRLCAEDPAHGDLPQSGRIARWQAPEGVRVDHALASGTIVPPFYDSMLAKLIASAPTRDEARTRLAHALDRTVCLGVTTNRGFLARLLRTPAFAAGEVDTGFLERHVSARESHASSWLEALCAAAAALLPRRPVPPLFAGWSSSPRLDLAVPLRVDQTTRVWQLTGTRGDVHATHQGVAHRIVGLCRIECDKGTHAFEVGAFVDGRPVRAVGDVDGDAMRWLADGVELDAVDARRRGARRDTTAAAGLMLAPMHGRVVAIEVEPGARVDAGALLLVIEAMKMEHAVRAPHGGTVAAVHVRGGDQVATRQPLVEVVP